jgi:cytochrome P450
MATSLAEVPVKHWFYLASAVAIAYTGAKCVYNLYFHPAAKFPGPKLAAVSHIYYSYHLMTGRYPWVVEQLHKKYGPVFRIAPDHVVFSTPQAGKDIYVPAVKNHETWTKTTMMDFGSGDLGFIWENDPVKRRAVAKKVLPAFSSKAIRAKEPILHMYIDQFIEKMKVRGSGPNGVDIATWMYWLGLDMSADLAYNREMFHMRDEKNSDFMNVMTTTLQYATSTYVAKMIPLMRPLSILFMPMTAIKSSPQFFELNKKEVQSRIDRRGTTKHPDFVDYMLPLDAPAPTTKQEKVHLEQVALQLFIAGFDPVRLCFYANLFFLLKNPGCYQKLVQEVRSSFESYQDITSDGADLPYLNGCLQESLRLWSLNSSGMPRISPGAEVDGVYVAKGIICQVSLFAMGRDPKLFHDAKGYHPERWLSHDHAEYDEAFSDDALKSYFPFGLGPRACAGREIAWQQQRVFLAKTLWSFDLEEVPGQEGLHIDKDFKSYITWDYPEFHVRFIERKGA